MAYRRTPTAAGFTDPEKLREHLLRLGYFQWKIYPADKRPANTERVYHQLIMQGENSESSDESNLDFLVEVLGQLAPGAYLVAAQPAGPKWTNTGVTTPFTILGDTATQLTAGIAGAGLLGAQTVEQRIALEKEKWDMAQQIKELKAEIGALADGPPSGVGERILAALEPHLGTLIPAVMDRLGMAPRTAPTIAQGGFDPQEMAEADEVDDEATAALSQALERWHDAEPDLVRVVGALADLAHRDPAKYATGKKLLGL